MCYCVNQVGSSGAGVGAGGGTAALKNGSSTTNNSGSSSSSSSGVSAGVRNNETRENNARLINK